MEQTLVDMLEYYRGMVLIGLGLLGQRNKEIPRPMLPEITQTILDAK